MTRHEVLFVGAGPGAEDLITLRGARALEEADMVLYAGSLVNPALLHCCKAGCAKHNSAGLDLDEQVALMSRAVQAGARVVRLHTGDPAVYGAIDEQISALATLGIGARIVPGVSSVFGAAAALGCELTLPGVSQSLVLTRTAGRTPMPAGENPTAFAKTGATLAFFLSAGNLEALTTELMEAGRGPLTPAAVVYRATWPDEITLRAPLKEIAARCAKAGIVRQAILLVGETLAPRHPQTHGAAATAATSVESAESGGQSGAESAVSESGVAKPEQATGARSVSRLYDPTFTHGYRVARGAQAEDSGNSGPGNAGSGAASSGDASSGDVDSGTTDSGETRSPVADGDSSREALNREAVNREAPPHALCASNAPPDASTAPDERCAPSEVFFDGACAIHAVNPRGRMVAAQLAEALRRDGLDATVIAESVPASAPDMPETETSETGAPASGHCASGHRAAEHLESPFSTPENPACEPSSPSPLSAAIWTRYAAHIFICAAGIAVRRIAPHLRDKGTDPAVLVCSGQGDVISLLSGHLGGANRLARRVARLLGGRPVISTATDGQGICAPDDIVARAGARALNPEAFKALNAALLAHKTVRVLAPEAIFNRYFNDVPGYSREAPAAATLAWDCVPPRNAEPVAQVRSAAYVLGIGCQRGVTASVLDEAARAFLSTAGLEPSRVACLASVACKADEPGLLELARLWRCPLLTRAAAELDAVPVPTPSETVRRKVGCASVAEAAALLVSGGRLVLPKQRGPGLTLALARIPHGQRLPFECGADAEEGTEEGAEKGSKEPALCAQSPTTPSAERPVCRGLPCTAPAPQRDDVAACVHTAAHPAARPEPTLHGDDSAACVPCAEPALHGDHVAACAPCTKPHADPAPQGEICVLGMGSGADAHLTLAAVEALEHCDVVAGYSRYLDLIRARIAGKSCIESGMTAEVARCRAALEAARAGRRVCLVSSGDAGILGMAGLIFELRAREAAFAAVPVRVVPGVTAASLAAASLGAPLQNGFALISLSDLLVPADEVRANVRAAAAGALPLVLYNPAGRKRRELFEETLDFLLEQRGPDTLCGLVRHAGRPEEERWTGRLADFPRARVDMSTLVLLGGPRTCLHGETLYEARGYGDKYLD